ncbi:MAG TPA: helicase-related protein [Alphaproteobacteria bacterium]|jgi:ATP-dependent RNA helicase SUPV3L1/SUV3|nr:helicase-related protein [Alphaproteobacteria bacterium]
MAYLAAAPRLTAVLGPTNTGKTYLAIERMLGHASGMIGFPLRLLARENYDRVVRLVGARNAALVTGEEKIVPPTAKYFLCTVESMPLGRPVAFLGLDEVQLAADPDRGHVFTDRLLRARGFEETMLLGADTIRPLIRRLLPDAEFIARPRFSTLAYAGPKKITRLPKRSAVIAFSAADVYELAELVRRHRGGAAVVLGALSPRARNAQVAMFQSGEVDHIVATDAIGMGLNMDIDHVAFARFNKFDGRGPRRLAAAEIAQIAGRAGRHMSDGTFGTTTEIGPLDAEIVAAVEEHRFDPLSGIFWRNTELDFGSLRGLLASLERAPASPHLIRAPMADDHMALATLSRDAEVMGRAASRDSVRLLWEVCQVPDYRKTLSDVHTGLIKRIYLHLTGPSACLPEAWVAGNIARLDRADGDIDTLASRIAHIRTWTYISYRGDWIADSQHWQEMTRAIEDKLSDALHRGLTQRFVDRRSALLMGRLKDKVDLVAAVNPAGEVVVEGAPVGRLEGFRFIPDPDTKGEDLKALVSAARLALRGEVAARVAALDGDGEAAFALLDDGRVAWRGAPVARLRPDKSVLAPRVEVLASDLLETPQRERIRRSLAAWLAGFAASRLGPLFRARDAELSAPARGLVFQMCEQLGALVNKPPRHRAALSESDRRRLKGLGLHLGETGVYFPALLKPPAVEARAQLWAAHHGVAPPLYPKDGTISILIAPGVTPEFYQAIGYRPFRDRRGFGLAIRFDAVERLLREALRLARQGPFVATPALCAIAKCNADDLVPVLTDLGFVAAADPSGVSFRLRPRREKSRKGKSRVRRPTEPARADGPFAKLRDLDLGGRKRR